MRKKPLSFGEYTHFKQGFTLVEMAIVLVVMGLIMASVISFSSSVRSQGQYTSTQTKEQAIKTALISFIAKNNRLPCPAVATLAPGAVGYGVEATPGTNPATACLLITPNTAGVSPVVTGVVPWISLGLTDEQGTDGYYNRFTYQVAQQATYTTLTSQTVSGIDGAIAIYSSGTIIPANQVNSCPSVPGSHYPCLAVAIIVSHGSNGYYAYNRQGTQIAGIGGADELENGNADSNFVMKDFVDSSSANPFDDIVLPMTASDLLTPLTNNGSVQSYNAILQNDFNSLTASITAAAVSNRNIIPGAAPCDAAFLAAQVLAGGSARFYRLAAPTAVNDPWGNPIQVTNITANAICSATPSTTVAFTLTSFGPDGVAGGGDDITENVNVSELQAAFNAVGW